MIGTIRMMLMENSKLQASINILFINIFTNESAQDRWPALPPAAINLLIEWPNKTFNPEPIFSCDSRLPGRTEKCQTLYEPGT